MVHVGVSGGRGGEGGTRQTYCTSQVILRQGKEWDAKLTFIQRIGPIYLSSNNYIRAYMYLQMN